MGGNLVWHVFGKVFSNIFTPLSCTRSITSRLTLKGILENINESLYTFLQSKMLSIHGHLLRNTWSIFIFWFTTATLRFAIRTVKVTPANTNSNIFINRFTQIPCYVLGNSHSIWWLNNPHALFWQGRKDTTFTI